MPETNICNATPCLCIYARASVCVCECVCVYVSKCVCVCVATRAYACVASIRLDAEYSKFIVSIDELRKYIFKNCFQ